VTIRTSIRTIAAGAVLLAACCLAGCGYHFAASGTNLPTTANTIYVAKFDNKTRITGLGEEFDRHLKDEIANHKRLELVDDPASADLMLNGTLRGTIDLPTAFNGVAEPTAYNYNLSLDAVLTDNRTHTVVWSTAGLTRQSSYSVVQQSVVATAPYFLQQNLRAQDIQNMPDLQVASTQRDFSRGQTMDDLAHDIYVNMSEGF
jgi:hypothetical protein